MMPADDIKGLEPGSQSENKPDDKDDTPAGPRPAPGKSVGPESEVRGGPEAPEEDAEG